MANQDDIFGDYHYAIPCCFFSLGSFSSSFKVTKRILHHRHGISEFELRIGISASPPDFCESSERNRLESPWAQHFVATATSRWDQWVSQATKGEQSLTKDIKHGAKIQKWPIEIDDFPSLKPPFSLGIFHGYVSHNQMGIHVHLESKPRQECHFIGGLLINRGFIHFGLTFRVWKKKLYGWSYKKNKPQHWNRSWLLVLNYQFLGIIYESYQSQ